MGRTLENDDATIVEAAKSVLADVDLDYVVATPDLLRVLRLLQGWPHMAKSCYSTRGV